MVTLISTGDRESDLYLWNELRGKLKDHPVQTFDCSDEVSFRKLLQSVQTVSLFQEVVPLVIHQIALDSSLLEQLSAYAADVYIVTATGKLPKIDSTIKLITTKVTDATLKSVLTHALNKVGIEPEKDMLVRLYLSLSTEDFQGRERISPSRVQVLLRQLAVLHEQPQSEREKLFELLVGTTENRANQWELLDHLFTTSKKKQHEYFMHLGESMSVYEIMSMAKSTLLLVLAITSGQQAHLDNASIASKLGKHPFYISSLARTISTKNITFDKAYRLVSRLFNLETTLKSGKLDDESIGFDFLLATSDR